MKLLVALTFKPFLSNICEKFGRLSKTHLVVGMDISHTFSVLTFSNFDIILAFERSYLIFVLKSDTNSSCFRVVVDT